MMTVGEQHFNVWKAKAISRGKLLERFRDTIQNMADNVTNEGDRVYFGSTNDYDELREIGQEMDMWKWDAIVRERPEPDPYADCRQLRAALAADDAEIARYREALEQISEMANWQIGVPTDTEAANEHARIAQTMAETARLAALAGGSDASA